MNRKYLLVFGAFLVIAGIVFLFSQKAAKQGNTQDNATALTATAGQLSPRDVVKNFYSWYLSYPSNPAASSGFHNSPYVSAPFKQQIASLYDPTSGYDPVFCKQNQMAHVAYEQKATQNYMEVVIHQDSTQGPSLYRVTLEHLRGLWLITDTVCMR